MGKKKSKQLKAQIWCWYCTREFEDEKVLMQHQKAKHFKCSMCPRRLNTAGGLAVHIQQVHKLEAHNLPRIENAIPGRDGYDIEIFGMVGIPAPDLADYQRRKEIELGLTTGTSAQPAAKRPRIEHKPLTDQELKAQLDMHIALMRASAGAASHVVPVDQSTGGVYGAAPQSYGAPPMMAPPFPGGMPPPGFFPPPQFAAGGPPGGFPPGGPPPFMPPFAPGMLPPGVAPPFLPNGPRPPFPAGAGMPPPGAFAGPPGGGGPPSGAHQPPPAAAFAPQPRSTAPARPDSLKLRNPNLVQTLPPFKKPTDLKYKDPNFSPEEHRSYHGKYTVQGGDRGVKRPRAEDLM